MSNPEELKCHEDLIILETQLQQGKTMDNKYFICENIDIFGYLGAQGGGGFNNQTGPILVHTHPLIYINLHVKYESNLIRTFSQNKKKIVRGHDGPKHQNVSKCRPDHSGDICGQNIKQMYIFGY